jgi:hypothetical protein
LAQFQPGLGGRNLFFRTEDGSLNPFKKSHGRRKIEVGIPPNPGFNKLREFFYPKALFFMLKLNKQKKITAFLSVLEIAKLSNKKHLIIPNVFRGNFFIVKTLILR